MRAVEWFNSADARGFAPLNSAFITLLPMKEGAIRATDFRTVSLVHIIGKIVKAMVLRLASTLPQLVNPNQSAFIKGRSIQHNFFMVQHSICSLHRRKVPTIMLKLDMAKASDSVSWPFLIQILRHRGVRVEVDLSTRHATQRFFSMAARGRDSGTPRGYGRATLYPRRYSSWCGCAQCCHQASG
jgi:hypothetical protein